MAISMFSDGGSKTSAASIFKKATTAAAKALVKPSGPSVAAKMLTAARTVAAGVAKGGTYSNKVVVAPKGSYNASNSSSGSSGNGGGGSSYDPYAAARAEAARAAAAAAAEKKAADKKAADATKKAVDNLHGQLGALEKSRNQAIANIETRLKEGRALLDKNYAASSGNLSKSLTDNEKSEHDQTYANTANRARERGDILLEAANQGVGETDNLRAQAMALRNWAANQLEVNRAFHDTQTSINSDITTLNAKNRQDLHNLYGQANVDKTSVYDDFYKGQADVWNQIFNIENQQANNKEYKVQYGHAGQKANEALGSKFKDPGVPDKVKNWQGLQTEDKTLNNSQWGLQDYSKQQQLKKPEGATLRKW